MYELIIRLYSLGVAIASLFNPKARKMLKGGREAFGVLADKIDGCSRYAWFHAASLGEFEQGRPIMERLRVEHPEMKILLTFFSPSGYEVRKDYKGADIVCYLPLDTYSNARRFVEAARPAVAFFIKYEFWWNYLRLLKRSGVPVYSVSSIFRPGQVFFRWYARPYARVLRCFTRFFVQNEESRRLLGSMGITDVDVTGDTRFDRVMQIKQAAMKLPLIDAFTYGAKVFVAGSSWPPDEEIFIRYFNAHPEWRLIIAPHVVSEDHLRQIERRLERPVVRYSHATPETVAGAGCLVVDCFGLLSSIYGYATVAYVGGGFGVGIHNLLEAAVWGVPVIFGPNNARFQEAQELKACGGGLEICSYDDFKHVFDNFNASPQAVMAAGTEAANYVREKAGATDVILNAVEPRLRASL